MSPAVSVIMPCYNHEKFVRYSLASALNQTLPDLEVIAIDDCSKDATPEILEEFDDPRLTIIRHEQNKGSAKTINEGIRRARGDYISILNSDDVYHPERLKYCLETAEANDLYMIGTDIDLAADPAEVSQEKIDSWSEWYNGIKNQYIESRDLKTTLIMGNLFITTSNFFCRRSLFNSIGPIADYRYVQDYEFVLRSAVAYPKKVHWSEHRMLTYRLHEANTIGEDGVGPNRQTLEILTRWIPDLLGGENNDERIQLFESHMLKLATYIELGSADQVHRKWQTDVATYQQVIEDERKALALVQKEKNDSQALNRTLITRCDELSRELAELAMSRSYRLGYALFKPLRLIRHIFRKITRSTPNGEKPGRP